MIRQRLGVVLESLRLNIKEGIKTASALGFKGIQINATQNELSPEDLSQTGRRELKRILDISKLHLCALSGELGAGFINENQFDFLIKRTKQIINLALDLQTTIITIQIGKIPTETGSAHWNTVSSVLNEIGMHAENYGCRLAARASFDSFSTVKEYLTSLQTQGIRLIYDPATFMLNNLDPIKGLYELHEYIEHTSLWDTRQTGEGRNIEVPIGEGVTPVEEFVSTLESIGYYGFYVINSKGTPQPIESIKKGREFLERF